MADRLCITYLMLRGPQGLVWLLLGEVVEDFVGKFTNMMVAIFSGVEDFWRCMVEQGFSGREFVVCLLIILFNEKVGPRPGHSKIRRQPMTVSAVGMWAKQMGVKEGIACLLTPLTVTGPSPAIKSDLPMGDGDWLSFFLVECVMTCYVVCLTCLIDKQA